MTVANQTNRTSVVGDGTTQEIPFSFPASATSDIEVRSRVITTGVESDPLTEDSDYTVSLSDDTGGTVTMITTFASTYQIHVKRNTPMTQLLDLEQGGSFNAENIEDAFDKNTKLVIENADGLARTLVFPDTDPSSSFADMPNSINRANKNLTFDSDGKPTASVSIETGSVIFSNIGTDIAEAANALVERALIELDTTDDVEFAEITSTDLITKSPWVDVRAFGATGGGVTDDTAAIQAAIDYAEANGLTLYFPPGIFLISSSLNITDDINLVRGEGYKSVIRATSAFAAIFDYTSGGTDATANNYVTIKDIFLDGYNNANYCIYATKFTRSNFVGVVAVGAKVANIALADNQWINNFYGCVISNGYQDGLLLRGTASNIINLYGCIIEGNDRIGIYIRGQGQVINIDECTIEGNGTTGIWAYGVRILNIHNNYFESNVEEGGVTVTDPTSFTIKADIVLSGDVYPVISFVNPLKNVSIKNNYHSGVGMDCMYYASAINSGEISGNYNKTADKVCLGIYGHRSYSRIQDLKMYNNRDVDGLYSNPIEILDAEPAADSYKQIFTTHSIQNTDVPYKNYMPQDFTAYTKVVDNGKSSEIYRNADAFRGLDAFIIKKAGDSSDTWGVTLDIDNDYPELLGKLCYFGAWVKWTGDTDNNVVFYTTTTGEHADYTLAAPSDWTFMSVLFTMPASGATTWEAGFRKLTAGTTDTIDVAWPVLARVGDGYLSHLPDDDILEIFQKGTTGGYYTVVSEATVDITAAASITCNVNVPSGSKLIGCQIRVDTALTGGETWDAEWNDGASLQSIVSNAAVAKNTKVNKFHDDNANTPITDAETDIVITKNGGGAFTAVGTIRCIAYYWSLRTLGDKS